MSSARVNVLRLTRIQVKNGFLRQTPLEFDHMRRFPPMARESLPESMKIDKVKIPYANLYHRVVARNPKYADETVYPGFGYQEPEALVLAKRQYQYMQEGMNEEDAYQKALEYIGEVENASFQKISNMKDVLAKEGASAPFLADEEIAHEVAQWQELIKKIPYSQLSLADQGYLDYFLQNKILKWTEVERERRMKDPVFVAQFQQFIENLFPASDAAIQDELNEFKLKFNENFFKLHNHDANNLKTVSPFFVDDYLLLLDLAIQQPDFQKWTDENRELLTKWVVDTLAFQSSLQMRSSRKVEMYLDYLRDSFFPMFRFPERALDMKPVTIDNVKALLYANEIGYKRVDDKLFVQRFYRLPMLLFPRDVVCTMLTSNVKLLQKMTENDSVLAEELKKHGISDSVADVKSQLLTYKESLTPLPTETVSAIDANSDEIDMSVLNDILDDSPEEEVKKVRTEPQVQKSAIVSGSPEWLELLKGKAKIPTSDLEKARHEFYSQVEYGLFENAQCVEDIEEFKQIRMENEIIARARLSKIFNDKEAARRRAMWGQRDFIEDLPSPVLDRN